MKKESLKKAFIKYGPRRETGPVIGAVSTALFVVAGYNGMTMMHKDPSTTTTATAAEQTAQIETLQSRLSDVNTTYRAMLAVDEKIDSTAENLSDNPDARAAARETILTDTLTLTRATFAFDDASERLRNFAMLETTLSEATYETTVSDYVRATYSGENQPSYPDAMGTMAIALRDQCRADVQNDFKPDDTTADKIESMNGCLVVRDALGSVPASVGAGILSGMTATWMLSLGMGGIVGFRRRLRDEEEEKIILKRASEAAERAAHRAETESSKPPVKPKLNL